MSADEFELRINELLVLEAGTGSFKETHTLDNGHVVTHEFSWATAMASRFRESEYGLRFGSLPGWVAVLHPSSRSLLCKLSLDFNRALPKDCPVRSASASEGPAKKLVQGARSSVGDPQPSRFRDPSVELIRQALLDAAAAERQLAPFTLSGRNHENRVTLDRQFARILRGAELPRFRVTSYGPSFYYPERVFQRAASILRQLVGVDVLGSSHNGTRYYILEQSPLQSKQVTRRST